jgi:hypothetical protein
VVFYGQGAVLDAKKIQTFTEQCPEAFSVVGFHFGTNGNGQGTCGGRFKADAAIAVNSGAVSATMKECHKLPFFFAKKRKWSGPLSSNPKKKTRRSPFPELGEV